MGARTGAREAALQMLYAIEMTHLDAEEAILSFWRELPGDAEARVYADELVRGIAANLEELDDLIRSASTHWRLERMSRVDRNILRVGAFELKWHAEVPKAVAMDEAVELAKRFGTQESGAFVNGLLDRIATLCGRESETSELLSSRS
ncbi:MAG: transcription antitermination factor NusB [Polyangiaceae bacterium]|nr:transcription antitermination factor NusB [Polyangiaceae bacterium]